MKKTKSIFSAIIKALIFSLIISMGFYFLAPRLGFIKYRAQAKILTTEASKIDRQDNTAYTYAETVNSDAVKNKVIENLKLDLNPEDLDKKMDIDTVSNTHIININVEDNIKLRAEDIADEYADITISVINQLYDAKAEILEYAYQNGSRLNPSYKMTSRIGLASFCLYLILALLRLSLKKSLKEDEIKQERRIRKVKDLKKDPEENIENAQNYSENIEENEQELFQYQNHKVDDDYEDTREIFENNGNEYKIIADIPKYDDGDLDV